MQSWLVLQRCERDTYNLRAALGGTSGALALVRVTSGHSRGHGGNSGEGNEDGLELHFS